MMSGEKEKTSAPSSSPYVEFCKGVNGLDKVILRESRGSSAEVIAYRFSQNASLVIFP